jgi:hypothetical protein
MKIILSIIIISLLSFNVFSKDNMKADTIIKKGKIIMQNPNNLSAVIEYKKTIYFCQVTDSEMYCTQPDDSGLNPY